jgi:MFS family permease
VGYGVTIVGLASMLLVLREDVTWLAAIPAFAIAGLGMGLAYSPLALIVLREASPETQGSASSSLSLTESLATAFGTGLTGALVAASVRATGHPAEGLAVAFGIATLIGLGGFALAGRLRPRRARNPALSASRAAPGS